MTEKEVLLSTEGLRKLEGELEQLKSVKRREVAERIKLAREFGDLSENSEYEEAKNDQAFVEGRIAMLEKTLRNARIVSAAEAEPDQVTIGSAIRLKDLEDNEEFEYVIVGSHEAEPDLNRISYMSPVGKAVFGQKVGVVVEVRLPFGVAQYELVGVRQDGI